MKKIDLIHKLKVYSEKAEQSMLRVAENTSTNPEWDKENASESLKMALIYSEMIRTGQYE